jgi:amino-acid N-acetyltransferase
MEVELCSATTRDLEHVERLLRAAELPLAGLRAQFPAAYVVARSAGEIVGVAGLELHDDVGLLRSVAVAPAHRSKRLGLQLVSDRLARAGEARLRAVYLLTTTAKEYFARFHFSATDRAAVPATLMNSAEFAHACPASAACLVWRAQHRMPASFAIRSASS